MFKKSILAQSMLLALAVPTAVVAETTMSVELKNETAVYTNSGQTIGQATSLLDRGDKQSSGDLMKFQNQAKIFLNGDIGEDSTWHSELQIIYDSEAVNDEDNGGINYKGHENYTQNDFFRELYVDTTAGGWDLRLGKQQVVWGTADGIKLLDIINPTDFREVNQNSPDEARIPIWMINAERNVGETGNVQFIVSQSEKNKIPGLNPGGDQGQPFIMKGVDSISGSVNGFYNIGPALSNVAATFNAAAFAGFIGGVASPSGLVGFGNITVNDFSSLEWTQPGGANTPLFPVFPPAPGTGTPGSVYLAAFAECGFDPVCQNDPNGNGFSTNLMQANSATPGDTNWQISNPKSAFEYMSNATFATFNTFTSFDPTNPFSGMKGFETEWVEDYPDDEANAGFRFKNHLDNGFNFSLNYFYHNSANPEINLDWVDPNTGEKLTVQRATATQGLAGSVPDINTNLSRNDSYNASLAGTTSTILVKNSAGDYYGAFNPADPTGATFGLGAPNLRFTETANRVHSLGGSFDFAVDSLDVPLVIRGEVLYDKDEKQAVVDKYLLGIGDLTNALTMQDADMFKYVIGADVTVMTNLLISGQFIQFWNLDYIDQKATCTNGADCSRYTGDFSTLNLSNGMNQAEENKEFYSLFLSKPIGEEQLGRWNNIFIYEENGGYWNRLDADYSVTDNFIVSAAWNNYWGDRDTTFGQLKEASSVQVGFKYIFDEY